jgi:hypothetical protein
MQTDSIVRQRTRRRGSLRLICLGSLLSLCGVLGGCHLAAPSVLVEDLLEPIAAPTRWMPNASDLASAQLARAALIAPSAPELAASTTIAGTSAVEAALGDLIWVELTEEHKGLLPIAIDLRNATFDNPIAYRTASRKLRSRGGLDPRLKSRLNRTIDDDPIRLAERRVLDGWHRLWARTFNTVSEPLGSSLITGFVLAPYQLINSVVHYFADFSNNEPLSLTDRQALTLRRDFLRAHPDTELTDELERKVEKSTILLEKTLGLRRVRAAENAFDAGNAPLALYQANFAIRVLSDHPKENNRIRKRAYRIASKAEKSVAQKRFYRARSLEARRPSDSHYEAEHALAAALLKLPEGGTEIAKQLADYRSIAGDAGHGRVEYILALRQHESGFDREALERLTKLSSVAPNADSMARHAKTIVDDDWQNPYGAFERLKRKAGREEMAWRIAGEWVNRTRYPNLPTPVAYLVDSPTIALTIILAPLRAMISPWTGAPDFRRAPSLAGYRYLVRYPAGAEQQIIVNWLYDYEGDMKRWGRTLRLADLMSEFDPKVRAELVEKTAEERIAQVDRLERRDSRGSVLKGVAREFPDSKGGHAAGLQARVEYEDASPQHIGITKSFLLENPTVAGPHGIGLNPNLLNDDDADGELHPDGVLLRGGRVLEIRLIADGADKKTPPESRQRKISKERLSQIAATLDEAVQRNSLIDVDARHAHDPGRDVYLERAGLGLTEDVDQRPAAESDFVYQSLRERYGLVRGRDSILPFDLVFRGSLGDFTLGAFPRWRAPRQTPDAFLYR